MKWTKVKCETPPLRQWVIGCLARESSEEHERLVRVALIAGAYGCDLPVRRRKYWEASDGQRLGLNDVSHWALIELPEDEGIAKLKVGDRVRNLDGVFCGDEYIVADADGMVALINLKSGALWSRPVKVCSRYNITGSDLDDLFGIGEFKKV